MNVYPFIEAEKRQRRNVKRACELLKVSRAAYYAQRDGQPSARQAGDAQLLEQIRSVHERSRGRYGAPRVHAELARGGHRHGRKRVARLMRVARLRGRAPPGVEEDDDSRPVRRGPRGPGAPQLQHRRQQAQRALVRRHHLMGQPGCRCLNLDHSTGRVQVEPLAG